MEEVPGADDLLMLQEVPALASVEQLDVMFLRGTHPMSPARTQRLAAEKNICKKQVIPTKPKKIQNQAYRRMDQSLQSVHEVVMLQKHESNEIVVAGSALLCIPQ
jgi:hypothetical protein